MTARRIICHSIRVILVCIPMLIRSTHLPDAPFKRTRKNRPTELEIIGKVSPKTTGTRIRYWADPEIFNDTAEFSYEQLIDRVRQTSFLVPGLKITVIDENIPETGDESVDEMLEVDDIANAAGDEPQEIAESDESEHDAAGHEEAAEQIEEADVAAQPQGSKYTHSRIEEFCHTGGVKDFVDYLSKGEAVSAIWRITGEDTYVEETQAVGDGGELHAQKVTRNCAVDIAMRWTNGYDTTMRSFVNVVETPGGGTHVDGYLLGLTKQIRKAIEDNARKLKVNLKDSNMKSNVTIFWQVWLPSSLCVSPNHSSKVRPRMCSAPRRSSRSSAK